MPDILRERGGKPYFAGSDVHFSVSHSGSIIAIAFSGSRVGIDIQKVTSNNIRGIAERFFPECDLEYFSAHGDDSFFEIWTRKEAYIKMLGGSVFTGIRRYPVTDGERFLDVIGRGRGKAYISEFSIGAGGVFCAAAGACETIGVSDLE